jgi:hypothetical protein
VGVLVKEEVEFLIILVCTDITGLGWTEFKAGSPPFKTLFGSHFKKIQDKYCMGIMMMPSSTCGPFNGLLTIQFSDNNNAAHPGRNKFSVIFLCFNINYLHIFTCIYILYIH